MYSRAASSPYLLSGFLKCGNCGANLVIVTGRGKGAHPRFGCPQNFHRGACENAVKQRAEDIEANLFSELQRAILRPEAVEYAIQGFQQQLRAAFDGLDTRLARMRQRAAQLQCEITNLAETAAQCGPTPGLVKQINVRQQELDEITRELLTAEPDSVISEIADIRDFVTERIENIHELLNLDVSKARVELAKHVTAIKMVPESDEKKGHYRAEGEWNLLGGSEGGESAFGWLRGVDLNHRPLGYEFNVSFSFFQSVRSDQQLSEISFSLFQPVLDTNGSNLVAISVPARDLSFLTSNALGRQTHESEVGR